MDTFNFSFLLLVGFLATIIIVVAMLPLDACRPDPPTGGNERNSDRGRTRPTAPIYDRLELASLYLRDLEARDWERLPTRLAASTVPAQLASGEMTYGDAHLRSRSRTELSFQNNYHR
jgi:hypothetical protein